MVRRTALTVILLASCVWCLALVARADSNQSGPAETAFKPAASLHSLMNGQAQHFRALAELLGDPKAEDRAQRLLVEAELLAELANVNTRHRNKPDYRAWAAQVRDTSLRLAAEVRKLKDADQARMVSLHEQIKATCTACHDVYQ